MSQVPFPTIDGERVPDFFFENGTWFINGLFPSEAEAAVLEGFTSFEKGVFSGPGRDSQTLAQVEAQIEAQRTPPTQDRPAVPPPVDGEQFAPIPWVDPFAPQKGTQLFPYLPQVGGWLVPTLSGTSVVRPRADGRPSQEDLVAAAIDVGDIPEARRVTVVGAQLQRIANEIIGPNSKTFDAAIVAALETATEDFEAFERVAILQNFRDNLSAAEIDEIEREKEIADREFQLKKGSKALELVESVEDRKLRREKFEFEQTETATDRRLAAEARKTAAENAAREQLFRIAETPADLFTQSAIAGGAFGPAPTGGRIRALQNQFLLSGEIPLPRFARGPSEEDVQEDVGVVPTSDVVNMGTPDQPINIRISDLERIRQSGGALGLQDVPHLSFSMQDNGFVASPFVIPRSVRSLGDAPITPPVGMMTPSDVARFQTGFKDAKAQGFEGEDAIRVVNEAFNQPGSDRISPQARGLGGFQPTDDENFVQELEAEGLTRNEAIEVSNIDFEDEFEGL